MTAASPPSLNLSVDRDSDVPLAVQLGWKLRTLIATGTLTAGARLPGVREVADAAGVNVNTVRSVYGRLEEEGLVSSQHGRGTFVADGAAPLRALAEVAAAAAREAREAGLDPRDVAAALFVGERAGADTPAPAADAGDTPAGGRPAAEERGERRALRAEIARLEGDLSYLVGLGGPPGPPRTRPRAGQMLTAAELRSVRDELVSRLDALRAEREDARRSAGEARRVAAAEAGSASSAPGVPTRVWRHGGTWTGPPPRVVYES